MKGGDRDAAERFASFRNRFPVLSNNPNLVEKNTMLSTRRNLIALFVCCVLAACAVPAYATITTTHAKSDSDTMFTLGSDTLGTSATITGSGTFERWVPAKLHDGLLGEGQGDGHINDGQGDFDNTVFSDATITYTLNTAAAPNGYDINRLETYMGWVTGANGRSNQGYRVDLTFVDNSTATLIAKATFEPNDPACYWTQVVHSDSAGGILDNGNGVVAKGVKAITFADFDAANAVGPVMVREIDVFGTASMPEPGTIALLITGILGLLAYAWRRR